MKKIALVLVLVLAPLGNAWAGKYNIDLTKYKDYPQAVVQDEFSRFSREAGLGLNFIPMAPAAPEGLTGFDIGIEATALDINEEAFYWTRAITDTASPLSPPSPPSYLLIPKIHVTKGLPFGLDIGIMYSYVPNSNIQLLGAEAKWAFVEGGIATPAIALRASYTKLIGVDYLDLQTERLDLSISKGIVFITPYAGIGGVFTQSEPVLPDWFPLTIEKESLSSFVGYLGLKLSLGVVKISLEADFANVPSYNLKLSVGL